MVPLQRNAYSIGRQEAPVRQRRGGPAQQQGQSRGPVHRLDLLARAGTSQENPVNTGVLIRLEALFRFSNAPRRRELVRPRMTREGS